MLHPAGLRITVRPGVDPQLPTTGGIGDGTLLRQHERRGQRQLLHQLAARLARGTQSELEQARTGQQDPALDHVIGQPREGGRRQATGEHQPVLVGQVDGCGQQRVSGGREAGGADVTAVCGAHGRPETAPLR